MRTYYTPDSAHIFDAKIGPYRVYVDWVDDGVIRPHYVIAWGRYGRREGLTRKITRVGALRNFAKKVNRAAMLVTLWGQDCDMPIEKGT